MRAKYGPAPLVILRAVAHLKLVGKPLHYRLICRALNAQANERSVSANSVCSLLAYHARRGHWVRARGGGVYERLL